jgi:hypothetical protein
MVRTFWSHSKGQPFSLSRRQRLRLERLESRDLPSTGLAGGTVREDFGRLPLSFEANQGQADAAVRFLAHGPGYGLVLTDSEAVLDLHRPTDGNSPAPPADVLTMALVGARSHPAVEGVDVLAGKVNYLTGSDPAQWYTEIPTFGKVRYHDVYPGIDLVYYGSQQQLEYDFVLGPGADPSAILLNFQGTPGMDVDTEGNLLLHTSGGDVVEHAPVVYQEGAGGRQPIEGHYRLLGDGRVGFTLGAYDPGKPLVIDPILIYSTYLGGSGFRFEGDSAAGIAVDAAGNAYVTGTTNSTDFPTTPDAFQHVCSGTCAFVTKLNPAGTDLVYSTYLGFSAHGNAIAIDTAGHSYITGRASSLPTTPGAFQTQLRGLSNAFVTELNAAGTGLIYSTYLGGERQLRGRRYRLWSGPGHQGQRLCHRRHLLFRFSDHARSVPDRQPRPHQRLRDQAERRRLCARLLHLPRRPRSLPA